MARVMCVAEAASAHDGSLEKAQRLVGVAADADADVYKIQYFHAPDRMADRRKVPAYYREVYRRYAVPLDWLPILRDQAHGCGLQFMCSVFLPEAVPLVAPFVDWLKIASFECLDWELVESAAHTAKPLMMSTGMTDARELNLLCGVRDRVGEQVRLLHCISEYPCSPEHLHLDVIEAYGLDGLSEHTTSIFTGAIVVARCPQVGIIERHVRLDDTDPANPDYAPALNPADYRRYVSGVREAEAIQNERRQRKQRNPAEDWARQYRVVNT